MGALVRSNNDGVIQRLQAASTALAEAKTIQDTKKVLDVATAAEIYAKRQQLSQDSIDYAHDIKIEALAQLGRMLKDTPKAKGGEHGGKARIDGTRSEPSNPTPTLADLGLDKKTSSIAQKLAALPAEQFEQVKAGTASIAQAIREVTHAQRPAIVAPTGTYRVIYADPPWSYGNSGLQEYGHASHHYPSMTIEELCALPIKDVPMNNRRLVRTGMILVHYVHRISVAPVRLRPRLSVSSPAGLRVSPSLSVSSRSAGASRRARVPSPASCAALRATFAST